jgi:hypothetical protein
VEADTPFAPAEHGKADVAFFKAYSQARQEAGLNEILADVEMSLTRIGYTKVWFKNNLGTKKKAALFVGRKLLSLTGADIVIALAKAMHQGAVMSQHTYLKKKRGAHNVLRNLRKFLDATVHFVKAKAGDDLDSLTITVAGRKNFLRQKKYTFAEVIRKYQVSSVNMAIAEDKWQTWMRQAVTYEKELSRKGFFKRLYGRVFSGPTLVWKQPRPPRDESVSKETRVTQLLSEIDLLAGQVSKKKGERIRWRVNTIRNLLDAENNKPPLPRPDPSGPPPDYRGPPPDYQG